MAILILAEVEPTDVWFADFIGGIQERKPDLDLRVWPNYGRAEEIEMVLAWWPPTGVLKHFPNLQLIISLAASVDRILADSDLPATIPIVRLVTRDKLEQMAEYVTLATLLFQRRFVEYQALQYARQWDYLSTLDAGSFTVGILGLGAFGSAAAKKLTINGYPVLGWSRTAKSIANVTCFYGRKSLPEFLSQCQVLICMLPLTPDTEGILCHETFLALPRGAYIINVGRGKHLIEADLLSALESGQIGGACLDVFDIEPLPYDHPFWSHPRIVVTPHISAVGLPQFAADYVLDVIERAQNGEPLAHLVDRSRGY